MFSVKMNCLSSLSSINFKGGYTNRYYRVCQVFGQAWLGLGGLVLDLSQFWVMTESCLINCCCLIKVGKSDTKIIILLLLIRFSLNPNHQWPDNDNFVCLPFQADRVLLDAVEGLHPIKEKHQFFIDIQPVNFIKGSCINDVTRNLRFVKPSLSTWFLQNLI